MKNLEKIKTILCSYNTEEVIFLGFITYYQ